MGSAGSGLSLSGIARMSRLRPDRGPVTKPTCRPVESNGQSPNNLIPRALASLPAVRCLSTSGVHHRSASRKVDERSESTVAAAPDAVTNVVSVRLCRSPVTGHTRWAIRRRGTRGLLDPHNGDSPVHRYVTRDGTAARTTDSVPAAAKAMKPTPSTTDTLASPPPSHLRSEFGIIDLRVGHPMGPLWRETTVTAQPFVRSNSRPPAGGRTPPNDTTSNALRHALPHRWSRPVVLAKVMVERSC